MLLILLCHRSCTIKPNLLARCVATKLHIFITILVSMLLSIKKVLLANQDLELIYWLSKTSSRNWFYPQRKYKDNDCSLAPKMCGRFLDFMYCYISFTIGRKEPYLVILLPID